jgi:hypothetical protein
MFNKTKSQFFYFKVDIVQRFIILNLTRSNVAAVNTIFSMKEDFLKIGEENLCVSEIKLDGSPLTDHH